MLFINYLIKIENALAESAEKFGTGFMLQFFIKLDTRRYVQ